MVELNPQKSIVQKGECAWKVAQKNLAAKGQKVTNADIAKEMKRLAKLNGCNSVEDFNNKFFSKIGNEYITGTNTTPAPESTKVKKGNDTIKNKGNEFIEDSVALQDATRVEPLVVPKKVVKKPKISTKEQEVNRINNMKDDASRIIEYNKKNYNGDYYGIVDKKTCQLKIYDKSGKVMKTFTVGVGKTKGDNLGAYYLDHFYKTKDKAKAETNRYTTAGEFTLDDYKNTSDAYTGKDGKPKVMALKGDNRGERSGQMSIHMLYKPSYAQRKRAIDSPGLEDNRMSYGCVNLTEEDYDMMHSFLGEGDKIYVLPEEKGNKLQLAKQKDGTYKFEQQYHKNVKRGVSKDVASTVKYDVRPEKNPKYIAEQKRKRAAEEKKLLAEQQAKKEVKQKEQEFSWLNPMTWFS